MPVPPPLWIDGLLARRTVAAVEHGRDCRCGLVSAVMIVCSSLPCSRLRCLGQRLLLRCGSRPTVMMNTAVNYGTAVTAETSGTAGSKGQGRLHASAGMTRTTRSGGPRLRHSTSSSGQSAGGARGAMAHCAPSSPVTTDAATSTITPARRPITPAAPPRALSPVRDEPARAGATRLRARCARAGGRPGPRGRRPGSAHRAPRASGRSGADS